MRLLHFEPDSKRYDICYQALLFAHAPRHRNELAAHGDLLTQLEAIGMCANPDRGRDDAPIFTSVTGGDVMIEEQQHELLKRFLDTFAAPPQGTPGVAHYLSREMCQVLNWIADIPRDDSRLFGDKRKEGPAAAEATPVPSGLTPAKRAR